MTKGDLAVTKTRGRDVPDTNEIMLTQRIKNDDRELIKETTNDVETGSNNSSAANQEVLTGNDGRPEDILVYPSQAEDTGEQQTTSHLVSNTEARSKEPYIRIPQWISSKSDYEL